MKNKQCFTCLHDGSLNRLEVHHIDKNRRNNKAENLVTLCSACHKGVHSGKRIRYKYDIGGFTISENSMKTIQEIISEKDNIGIGGAIGFLVRFYKRNKDVRGIS